MSWVSILLDMSTAKAKARTVVKSTKTDRSWIKKLRKLGMSDEQIAKTLELPEDSLLLR